MYKREQIYAHLTSEFNGYNDFQYTAEELEGVCVCGGGFSHALRLLEEVGRTRLPRPSLVLPYCLEGTTLSLCTSFTILGEARSVGWVGGVGGFACAFFCF